MSDWDDWTEQANDDDLLDYSIQSEKDIPPHPSGVRNNGSGCLVVVMIFVGLIVFAAIIITIFGIKI